MTPGIDIVLSLDDLSDLPLLDRALFTILAQSLDVPLHIHLMLPRFSSDDLHRTRHATDSLRGLAPSATLCLHNWDSPGPLDLRVPLLNWSVEIASCRYFALLEVTDLLSAGALQSLLNTLRREKVALVEATLLPQPVTWWGDVMLPLVRSREGDSAACFLADRGLIQLRDLVFTSGPGKETDRMLAFLREHYAAVRLPREAPIGVRQVPQ